MCVVRRQYPMQPSPTASCPSRCSRSSPWWRSPRSLHHAVAATGDLRRDEWW